MLQTASKKARCSQGTVPTPIRSLHPRGGWGRGANETGLDPDRDLDRTVHPGVRGSGVCWDQKSRCLRSQKCAGRSPPTAAGRGQAGCPALPEPKVCTAKFGCRTTVRYVIPCSAGGRFPSVKIVLFCLISQFCKIYC